MVARHVEVLIEISRRVDDDRPVARAHDIGKASLAASARIWTTLAPANSPSTLSYVEAHAPNAAF